MPERVIGTPAESARRLVRLGLILWLTTLALFVFSIPLTAASIPKIGNLLFPDDYFPVLLGLVNSSVGFLIVRFQPRQRIGWLFMALAIPLAASNLAQSYAVYGLIIAPKSGLPGLVFAAWLQKWLVLAAFPIPFALLFMLFPNGRLPTRKWRWVSGFALVILFIQIIHEMLGPGIIRIYIANGELALPILNPMGIHGVAPLTPIFDFTWIISMSIILAGTISLLVRFRTAGWAERQQLKWLVFFLIIFFSLLPFSFGQGESVIDDIAVTLLILMLPAGTAIAILRYKLYGIDVIIRRTIQYTLLTGILAAVYFGLVISLQTLFSELNEDQSPLILVISTLSIAALFNPVRLRFLAFIDRRFFRSKYDAEKFLEQFALAARAEVDLEQLGAAMIGTVRETIQPDRISLWIIGTGN